MPPKNAQPAPPKRPLALGPRIFLTLNDIKSHLIIHHDTEKDLASSHPQYDTGVKVIRAYEKQAPNTSLAEQWDYKRLIYDGKYFAHGSAISKPSNHSLDRAIKESPSWAKYVFLHAYCITTVRSLHDCQTLKVLYRDDTAIPEAHRDHFSSDRRLASQPVDHTSNCI
ncbi:hypothetical protein ACQKWADRAFT_286890 [Trichoderma austrokoningii]